MQFNHGMELKTFNMKNSTNILQIAVFSEMDLFSLINQIRCIQVHDHTKNLTKSKD